VHINSSGEGEMVSMCLNTHYTTGCIILANYCVTAEMDERMRMKLLGLYMCVCVCLQITTRREFLA
jgi:hypothetical protein